MVVGEVIGHKLTLKAIGAGETSQGSGGEGAGQARGAIFGIRGQDSRVQEEPTD